MGFAFPRLHVVTDTRPAAVSAPLTVVRAAVSAAATIGATDQLAVQVRVEDDATDREAYELTLAVLGLCRAAEVLCLVNDRLHIALAVGADGAHVGADDLPVRAARTVLDLARSDVADFEVADLEVARSDVARSDVARPDSAGFGGYAAGSAARRWTAVLGATCREPLSARRAVADGATYLGVGPAFATGTKSGLPDPIGPAGISAVVEAVPGTPVVAIGGVTVESVAQLRAAGAWGVAVVGALSSAADPGRAAAALLKGLTQ